MRCSICKKTSDQVALFEGILYDEMVRICEPCAENEHIPLIKKPSEKQLGQADKRYSVRERMEYMSGMRKRTDVSDEQHHIQGTLARLTMPPKKELHEDVEDNYYWAVNIARRRKKLSISQVAEKTGIEKEIIAGIEKGKIPENFHEIFSTLESFFSIKLLKKHAKKINFKRNNRDEEKEILALVERKMHQHPDIDTEDLREEKRELDRLSRGEYGEFERNVPEDVTLNDLVEAKRKKDKKERITRRLIQTESLLGDDIELEFDE